MLWMAIVISFGVYFLLRKTEREKAIKFQEQMKIFENICCPTWIEKNDDNSIFSRFYSLNFNQMWLFVEYGLGESPSYNMRRLGIGRWEISLIDNFKTTEEAENLRHLMKWHSPIPSMERELESRFIKCEEFKRALGRDLVIFMMEKERRDEYNRNFWHQQKEKKNQSA